MSYIVEIVKYAMILVANKVEEVFMRVVELFLSWLMYSFDFNRNLYKSLTKPEGRLHSFLGIVQFSLIPLVIAVAITLLLINNVVILLLLPVSVIGGSMAFQSVGEPYSDWQLFLPNLFFFSTLTSLVGIGIYAF